MRAFRLLCLLLPLLSGPALAQAATPDRDWFPGSSSISEPETIPPAYRGAWAANKAQCKDPDGVDRIVIMAEGVDYYESGGRLVRITQAGEERSVKVKLAYEGEGEVWDRVEVWTLNAAMDRLTMEDQDQGDDKSPPTVWIRCE